MALSLQQKRWPHEVEICSVKMMFFVTYPLNLYMKQVLVYLLVDLI